MNPPATHSYPDSNPTISILGCGWLGLPLGVALAAQGWQVKGSTTSPQKLEQLAAGGLQPFLFRFNPALEGDSLHKFIDFLSTDVLIISIPPKAEANGSDFHRLQIQQLISHLKEASITKVIYISSTSVYPDLNREVTETEPLPQEGTNITMWQAESLLQSLAPVVQTTVLRCGGLMGYNRMAGRYVAGKKGLTTGSIRVNFVHRDDVIRVIEAVIQQEKWGKTYNVVAPLHPTRREIYLQNAADFKLVPPEFAKDSAQPFKIISASKLIEELKYTFLYPDPLQFPYAF
ncbi:MAG: SDR family oxidoreductase [Bacteroidota bacterium]